MTRRTHPYPAGFALTAFIFIVPFLAAAQAPRGAAARRAATFEDGPEAIGAVALTFDDGPHPTLTPRLLEILKSEGVPATFFLIGTRVKLYPEVARQIVEAGFEVANHTYNHADLPRAAEEKVTFEILETQRMIEAATGRRPRLFRAPFGATSDAVFRVLQAERLDAVRWSIDPLDWDGSRSSADVREAVVSQARAGSIVLMHDMQNATVEAVPGIIAGIRAKGLRFVTAGEMVTSRKAARARMALAPQRTGDAAGAKTRLALTSKARRVVPPPPERISMGATSLKKYRNQASKAAATTKIRPVKTPPPKR